jgi:hypothetical protein
VTGIAADHDRIYIADGQVPAIRIYDLSGSFVDNLGREGSGPGEYRYPAGSGVDADGRVYTLDMVTGRLLMYSHEGEPLATSMPMPCCRNDNSYVLVAPAGQPYVIGYWRRQEAVAGVDSEQEYAWGILPFGLDGTVPFPLTGSKWQISTDGGAEPVWSRDGRALYYRSGNRVMVVDIDFDPVFDPQEPRTGLSGAYDRNPAFLHNFDVLPDGRFVMVKSEEPRTQLIVHLDWLEQLTQLVPTDR